MGAPAREDSAEQWTAATQQTGEVQISPRPEGSFTPGEQQVFQSQISSQRMSIFENQPLSRNEPGAEDSSAGSSASTISNWQKSENGPASPRGTGLDDQVAPEGISGPLVQTPARIHLDQQSSTRRLRSLDSLSILSDLTRPTSNIRNAVSPEGGPDIPLTLVSAPFLEIPEKKGTGRRGSFEARKGARAYTKFACLYFLSLAITWVCVIDPLIERLSYHSFAETSLNLLVISTPDPSNGKQDLYVHAFRSHELWAGPRSGHWAATARSLERCHFLFHVVERR